MVFCLSILFSVNLALARQATSTGLIIFDRDREIIKTDLKTLDRTVLSKHGMQPVWFPDGTRIAFSDKPTITGDRVKINTVIIDVTGKILREISNDMFVEDVDVDGTLLLQDWHDWNGHSAIGVFDLNVSSEIYRMSPNQSWYSGWEFSCPKWEASSDSSFYFLVQKRNAVGLTIQILSCNFRLKTIRTMSSVTFEKTEFRNVDSVFDLAIAPTGREVAIAISGIFGKNHQTQIFKMNIDGSNLQQLTAGSGTHEAPCWSPDGSEIMFNLDRSSDFNRLMSLWIMNADGSNQKRVFKQPYLFPLMFVADEYDARPQWIDYPHEKRN